MSGGTFCVARSIWTHVAFADEPFTEREAFMWMIGEASWKPREVRFGKFVVATGRGQLAASVRFMAEAWDWSKSRVARFLKKLEKRDTIRTESGTGVLVITICDYDDFQSGASESGTEDRRAAGQKRDSSGTVAGQTRRQSNQDKQEEDPPLPPDGGGAREQKPDPFIAFWAAYPKRVERKGAEKKFRAAVKSGVDPGRIIAGARRYAGSDAVRRGYVKNPTTWLNNGCWDDEAEQPQQQRGSDERPRKRSALGEVLADIRGRAAERREADRGLAEDPDSGPVVDLLPAGGRPGHGEPVACNVGRCAGGPAAGGDRPVGEGQGPITLAAAAGSWRN